MPVEYGDWTALGTMRTQVILPFKHLTSIGDGWAQNCALCLIYYPFKKYVESEGLFFFSLLSKRDVTKALV